jgi:MoxR-like ATPase
MLLQFFGLLMVAHGLSKLRRDFAQPPLSAKMVAWFKRLAAIFRTPEPITLEGSAGSYALAGAEVTLEHKVGPGASLERRLEVLEKNFELFRDETSTKVRGLREDLAAARKSIERETHERQAEDKKVARMIEEVAIGGLDLEMVGLFWLILGVIFTSIPT